MGSIVPLTGRGPSPCTNDQGRFIDAKYASQGDSGIKTQQSSQQPLLSLSHVDNQMNNSTLTTHAALSSSFCTQLLASDGSLISKTTDDVATRAQTCRTGLKDEANCD